MKFLITGGAGYIGSTICSALEDAGHTPVILDSLVHGELAFTRGRIFYESDIADAAVLENILRVHPDIEATIHCAAFLSVPESVSCPYEYYQNNVAKSLELFNTLNRLGQKRVIFSSSGSVYDIVPGFQVSEDSPLNPRSPYARTKAMIEMILQDLCKAYGMRAIILRYFNPIGADPKLRSGVPKPDAHFVLSKLVAASRSRIPTFQITGVNWPTRDGSGMRDYVHVWDLARAHVLAAAQFDEIIQRAGVTEDGTLVINLGSGSGVTVRELLAAFEKVYGSSLHIKEVEARPGDVAGAYARIERAKQLMDWEPELSLEQGIADALRWAEVHNPRSLI